MEGVWWTGVVEGLWQTKCGLEDVAEECDQGNVMKVEVVWRRGCRRGCVVGVWRNVEGG